VIAGDHRQRRWIVSGGFQSCSAPIGHFGLPPGTEAVSVEVTWPDGQVQQLPKVAVNRQLVVHRPG